GRVGHVVRPAAVLPIAPDVMQVEPVSDLVRARPAEVERLGHRPRRAERRVENDDTVRRGRTTRELRVAEQPTAERAYPEIEVLPGRPRGGPAPRFRLDAVVVG